MPRLHRPHYKVRRECPQCGHQGTFVRDNVYPECRQCKSVIPTPEAAIVSLQIEAARQRMYAARGLPCPPVEEVWRDLREASCAA